MCSTPEPVQVTDPADSEFGAGAGPNFDGHRQAARTFRQSAGVVEGRPGIIESTHIDPLSETSNEGAFASLTPVHSRPSCSILCG